MGVLRRGSPHRYFSGVGKLPSRPVKCAGWGFSDTPRSDSPVPQPPVPSSASNQVAGAFPPHPWWAPAGYGSAPQPTSPSSLRTPGRHPQGPSAQGGRLPPVPLQLRPALPTRLLTWDPL